MRNIKFGKIILIIAALSLTACSALGGNKQNPKDKHSGERAISGPGGHTYKHGRHIHHHPKAKTQDEGSPEKGEHND